MYSITQYICAAIHTGKIDPEVVIERLEDRHKAKLPELGLNTHRALSESKIASVRNTLFLVALLVPSFWIISILSAYHKVEEGELSVDSYIFLFLKPLVLIAIIGFVKVITVNLYLKRKILGCNVTSDDSNVQNAVIFGGFSPFAGYGNDQDGWSFTIDSSKPKDLSSLPIQFEQVELLEYISKKLNENVVEGNIQDKLFVRGGCIRRNKIFLADIKASPATVVDLSVVKAMIGAVDLDVRHYRLISIPSADEQFFLTFFFRSSMLGGNLFVECRSFLLPPLKPELTELNKLRANKGFQYFYSIFLSKLLLSPFSWIAGLWSIFLKLNKTLSSGIWALFGHPEDKLKLRQEEYNYGQETSLREAWASKTYQSYFQLFDKDMISKTCQHIIINSIVEFLDSKGIATDDIKERRTQIFNSGVMVSGGTVNAQQLAVGTGAAVKSKISGVSLNSREKG
jgi:hypothetical protein